MLQAEQAEKTLSKRTLPRKGVYLGSKKPSRCVQGERFETVTVPLKVQDKSTPHQSLQGGRDT